jgi:hypothetical protein
MTGEQLLEEGRKLSRPCVYLRDMGEGDVAAVWGGPGAVAAPDSSYKHWLSLDCRFLPEPANLAGCLSVYTDEEEGGIAAVDTAVILLPTKDGIPLFGHNDLSMPPIDAIFRFGSAAVQDWLRDNAWEPEWGYNDNFSGRDAVAGYESAVQKMSPLYTGTAFAQLGGWNMPWPEGDWEELLDQTLLVWTFQDAEPWVEVWQDAEHELRVIQRIT